MKKHILLPIIITALISGCCGSKKNCKSKEKCCYTVSSFYESFQAPCGQKHAREDELMWVSGVVDEANIFTNVSYSYDKFFVKSADGKQMVEVKVETTDNATLFKTIKENAGKEVCVQGKLTGFDAPVNGNCKRAFKLTLTDAAGFKGKK
ncbi:MAG: hypothetical protein V2A54_00445 [Bacteroidota bacterium]